MQEEHQTKRRKHHQVGQPDALQHDAHCSPELLLERYRVVGVYLFKCGHERGRGSFDQGAQGPGKRAASTSLPLICSTTRSFGSGSGVSFSRFVIQRPQVIGLIRACKGLSEPEAADGPQGIGNELLQAAIGEDMAPEEPSGLDEAVA